LPQKIVGPVVRNGYNLTLMGHRESPIVVKSGLAVKNGMYVGGDVRYGGTATVPILDFRGSPSIVRTRFTVLNGGSLTVSGEKNPFVCISSAPSYLSLGVEKGASLSFTCASYESAVFDWWAAPSTHVVDGTLDIQSGFGNRQNQTFAGSGTLRIAKFSRTGTAARALTIADGLTLESPAVWETVSSEQPNAPYRLVARGAATVKTSGDWTYGPASGVSTTTAPSARSCEIFYGSTLTLNPGGKVATFKDPVVGNGLLVITNGTLRIEGDVAPTLSVAVRNGSVLAFTSAKTFAKAELADGAVFDFSLGAPLTVASDVCLEGVAIVTDDPEFVTTSGWHPLVVASGKITGVPAVSQGWKTKVVEENGGSTLYAKAAMGLSVIVR